MKYLDEKIIKKLNDKKRILDEKRPLSPSIVKKLREQFQIEMTYNSNAIEGNKLTLRETALVLSEGVTISSKPLKDHLEAKDHKEALEYIYDIAGNDSEYDISEHLIRRVHQIVMDETDKEWAGRYRNTNVRIAGAKLIPPSPHEVPSLMSDMITWFQENGLKLHIVELAALLHHKIAKIHPFVDGNGRTARLVMNLVLIRCGYPLTVILKNDRKKYYETLALADSGKQEVFIQFVARALNRSLNIYINALDDSLGNNEQYKVLSEIAKITRYSAKYLNLLARLGKLDAHKEGRNWVTNIDAVNDYIKNRKRKRQIKKQR